MGKQTYLDGTLLRSEIQGCIKHLDTQNECLNELLKAYNEIVDNDDCESDTTDVIKDVAEYYADILTKDIRANLQDIEDLFKALRVVPDAVYDIEEINSMLQSEQNDLADTEAQRDEMQEAYNNETSPTLKDYYYQQWVNYCEECENIQDIISDLRVKKEEFLIVQLLSKSHKDTIGLRRKLLIGFNSIDIVFEKNNYDVTIRTGDWKEESDKIVESMPEYDEGQIGIYPDGDRPEDYYRNQWFDPTTGEYDIEQIFSDMRRIDRMTEKEYNAFMDILRAIGINISYPYSLKDYVDENIAQIVQTEIETQYNNALQNPSSSDASPFNALSQEERELYVLLYEDEHKEDRDAMQSVYDQFAKEGYNGWEEDILNIKFLIYTADEPYKSLYLKNISKVNIKGFYGGGSCSGTDIYINVNANPAGQGRIEIYSLFFHESSHAVDHLIDYYKDHSEEVVELLLTEISGRIDDAFNNWLTKNSVNDPDALRRLISACFMNQIDYSSNGTPDFDYLIRELGLNLDPTKAEECYNAVRSELLKNISGPVSDNFGGLTGNTLRKDNGHPAINSSGNYYWLDDGDGLIKGRYIYVDGQKVYERDSDPGYFDEDIIKMGYNGHSVDYDTGMIAGEFFAEYMDAHITKRYTEINNFNTFNQQTTQTVEDLVRDHL